MLKVQGLRWALYREGCARGVSGVAPWVVSRAGGGGWGLLGRFGTREGWGKGAGFRGQTTSFTSASLLCKQQGRLLCYAEQTDHAHPGTLPTVTCYWGT